MAALESRTHTSAFVEPIQLSPIVSPNPDVTHKPGEANSNFTSQSHILDDDSVREECGVVAIVSKNGRPVYKKTREMMGGLQHRGYDAGGMGMPKEGKIVVRKKLGKVTDAFPDTLDPYAEGLTADRGIGHLRYNTTEDVAVKDNIEGAHPMVEVMRYESKDPFNEDTYEAEDILVGDPGEEGSEEELGFAFNGNVAGKELQILASRFPDDGREILPYDTAYLTRAVATAKGRSLKEKVKNAFQDVNYAYSAVGTTSKGKVFGVRSPSGTWPLWVGKGPDAVYLASETIAENSGNVEWREVRAGEYVELTPEGYQVTQLLPKPPRELPCFFNAAYLAHGDSLMTDRAPGLTYDQFREAGGRMLRKKHPVDADIIIGVPNSGTPIGRGVAKEAGVELSPILRALTKDRSYMQPTTEDTHSINNGKFALDYPETVVGKVVELDEDMVVKGNSTGGDWRSRESQGRDQEDRLEVMGGVVGLFRQAGAKEIHVRVFGPKIISGCTLGSYMPAEQLVAIQRKDGSEIEVLSNEAIAKRIGADSIEYLTLDELGDVYEETTGCRDHCGGCFGGLHPREMFSQSRIEQRELVGVGA
jgi:amidophosphoribosyltransferase